jgi:hypothetical protein
MGIASSHQIIQRWNVTDLVELSPSSFGGFGGEARFWWGE